MTFFSVGLLQTKAHSRWPPRHCPHTLLIDFPNVLQVDSSTCPARGLPFLVSQYSCKLSDSSNFYVAFLDRIPCIYYMGKQIICEPGGSRLKELDE